MMVIESNAFVAHAQDASPETADEARRMARATDVCATHSHAEERLVASEYEPMRALQLRCQRVLGELFGWEFAPNVPARERAAEVLYQQLAPRVRACDPSLGDLRALAPCPEVDRNLQRLVAIVQGADLPVPCSAEPHTHEIALQHVAELVRRIQEDPVLQGRARTLRQGAALAETALEHHWSRRLLAQLRDTTQPFARASTGQARTHALETCLGDFPYTHNYLQLLAAEVALLQQPAVPLLLRDRDLLGLSPAARRQFAGERSKLRAFAAADGGTPAPLHTQTIAVCGCGPLPITGLMLHTWTGARVVLVDRDPASIAAASAWVDELERLQVLEQGAVRVRYADIDQLDFTRDLAADIVLIASLVDHGVKRRLAERWHLEHARTPHTLLLRSAGALCAELAYEAVDTHAINHPRLPFCGECLPRTQVWRGLDVWNAAARGVATDETSELLVIAHRNVLNSTELYRRVPLSAAQLSELDSLTRLLAEARASRPESQISRRT